MRRRSVMVLSMVLAGCTSSRAELADTAALVSRDIPAAGEIRLLDSIRYGRDKQVARFGFANGLKVILLSDRSSPVLSYQTWFGVGSRFERPGKTGIAHLFEHLMFKGTRDHPHEVFDRMLEEAGAHTNASTWLDFTSYYENLPASQIDLAAKLESDRMTNLVLTNEQLDSERDVVKNERRLRVENDPDGRMDETLLEMVFPTHPYGRPTLGTMEDLDSLTLDECVSFYRIYYSPGNATIVIVGDVSVRDALATVARRYGGIPMVDVPRPESPPEAEQTARRDKEIVLPMATEHAKMAWRTVPATSPDVFALDVAAEILFGNDSSRLYRVLVEEKELASEVDGDTASLAVDGLMLIDVVMNEKKAAEEAVEEVLAQIEGLARRGPTKDEMNRARNHAEASFLRSLNTVGSRASYLGMYEVIAGDYRRMFSFVDSVRAVGARDVMRVAGRYLSRARANVLIGRPDR